MGDGDKQNALKHFAQKTGLVKGSQEVEFKLTNLTTIELQLCVCVKALLCDPRYDKLRRQLNQGTGMELCITPAGGIQIVANEWQFAEGRPERN
jgi:hypothetical protein